MLARRLSHVLVFRASDNRNDSPHLPHWTSAADAFFNQEAEGEWYVPSYSVCVRAVLETGVVPPHHPVVRDAFTTIEHLAARAPAGHPTWIDPTRSPEVAEQVGAGEFQHGKVDVTVAVPTYDATGALVGENASGLHAAVMAYAGLRRALAREDPRDLLDPPPLDRGRRPSSPFRAIEAERLAGTKYGVRVTAQGSETHRYEEDTEIRREAIFLLQALAESVEPLSRRDLARAIHRRAGRSRHSRRESSVGGLIGDINRQFGVRLVESVPSDDGVRYVLQARLVVHE